MKKIIIIRSAGNELANQLWNYASVYAYALERGYLLENPAFFEYGEYFGMRATNPLMRLAFFLPFRDYTKRKFSLKRRLWRKAYTWYSNIIMRIHRDRTVSDASKDSAPYYLPPTKESSDTLHEIEASGENIYLDGWLFRNPAGLEKYRDKIREYLEPRPDIGKAVQSRVEQLRSEYNTLVGVHIRQGDYATWRGGAYLIPQTRVREIIDEYLISTGTNPAHTCFVITSDGRVDTTLFEGLHTWVSKENAIHDLFLLSATDCVIGSNSTFGAWAAYYGNIPFTVMQKDTMDWEYYRDKKVYFENKYSTMVHY
jgi:hypothetical protein